MHIGDAKQILRSKTTALLKKRSKNAKLLDLLGPTHHCGALVEHHMNGLMCAGLSSHLHLNSLQRTRQATTRRGSISVM